MKNLLLKRQLKQQGATSTNAKELTGISSELKNVVPDLDSKAKKEIAGEIGFKPVRISNSSRWATGGAFAVLLVLVMVAQSAQPGSLLYALKRGTEEVRVIIQPGFDEEDLKQRREDERKHSDDEKPEDHQGEDTQDSSKQEDGDHSESEDSPQEVENEVQKPEDQKIEDQPDKVEQKDASGEDIPKPEDQSTED